MLSYKPCNSASASKPIGGKDDLFRLNKRGGYRAVKDSFADMGVLDKFHDFENEATREALSDWAESMDIEMLD